jgi:phage terminase large subunit-like protein
VTLFEVTEVPGAVHDRRANRSTRNASRQVRLTTRPSWLDWSGSLTGRTIRFIETYCIVPKGHGAGKPMVLADFQKDAIEQLLGDGVRTGEFSLGRGNGKSSFMAGFGLAHLFLDEWSPQVPLIAITLKQVVKATYSVAVRMVQLHNELDGRALVYTAIGDQRIAVSYNSGEMFPLASDIDALQGLDPSLALVDEVGFIGQGAWDALQLAGGKRPNSLIVGLGTTGKRDSALHRLHEMWRSGVDLAGHCRINYSATPGCDIRDRAEWRRANPAIDAGFLAEDAIAAAVDITPEDAFRAFRLNQWVDLVGTESWLGPNALAIWKALADPGYQWDDRATTYAGVDVSLRHDTTAVVAVQQRPDGRWHARSWIFRAPEGRPVDQGEVRHCIRQIPALAACAYDPRFFEGSAQELAEEGVPMIEVPQTAHRMVPAIGNLYRLITGGGLSHDGAPDFAAQVTTAVARHSDNGMTLSKLKSDLKIDAAIALALAVSMADTAPLPVPDDAFRIW